MQHDSTGTWFLIAFGAFILLCTLHSMYNGRMTVRMRHRWGFAYNSELERDDYPLAFWFQIFLQILIGGGMIGYGIMRLVEGP